MMHQTKTEWERALEAAIQSVRKLCDVEVCKEVALGLVAYKFISDSHPDLKRDWTFQLLLNRASDGFLTTDERFEPFRSLCRMRTASLTIWKSVCKRCRHPRTSGKTY